MASRKQAADTVIYFLSACIDGASKRRSPNPRIHHCRCGTIVPISTQLRHLFEGYGFFNIVRAISFHASLAWLAYCRSSELDWSRNGLTDKFYLWEWESGDVVNLGLLASKFTRDGTEKSVSILGQHAVFTRCPMRQCTTHRLRSSITFGLGPAFLKTSPKFQWNTCLRTLQKVLTPVIHLMRLPGLWNISPRCPVKLLKTCFADLTANFRADDFAVPVTPE